MAEVPITVLDFPEVVDTLPEDILYLIRGSGLTRDKKIQLKNFLSDSPNHNTLLQRLNAMTVGEIAKVEQGGLLEERGTPDFTVQVSAVKGTIAGIDISKGFASWTRIGITVTVNEKNHGRSNGDTIVVQVTSDAGAIPLAEYTVANKTDNNFEITGVDTGAASGTTEFATVLTPTAAPGSNIRLDYVVVNSDNSFAIVDGVASATPDFPSVSVSQLILGPLVIKDTTTTINRGVECFTFRKGNHPSFPNLYINTTYTATDKSHNNVIVDSTAVITGTLQCQGYCWVANYNNPGADGILGGPPNFGIEEYDNDTTWQITNTKGETLDGTGGPSTTLIENNIMSEGAILGGDATAFTVKAYNIYVNLINLNGGKGATVTSEDTTADGKFGIGNGASAIGSTNGRGGDGGLVTLEVVDTIEIITGATVELKGGQGTNGFSASSGTVGNLGGAGGDAGPGKNFVYTAKTFINNGTITNTGGVGGTGGVGSGGSDNNGNGSAGANGGNATIVPTLYDFTTGLPATYANWVHALYAEVLK